MRPARAGRPAASLARRDASGDLDDVTENELEERLSRPDAADIAAMRTLEGDILVLGASGKMGPSLCLLARRASLEAGGRRQEESIAAGGRRPGDTSASTRRIIGVSRFSDRAARAALEAHGIETIAADLLDRAAVEGLPDCPNVVYMAGQKFGTSGDSATTWATNVHAAGLAAERFARSRIVAFSTGNVYPLSPAPGPGPAEADPTGPIGEYAQSALGRERILEYWSRRNGTRMAILRLN
jgi:nucleoside-diphosphate-sugar epimerase